jgi:hypothetical protein
MEDGKGQKFFQTDLSSSNQQTIRYTTQLSAFKEQKLTELKKTSNEWTLRASNLELPLLMLVKWSNVAENLLQSRKIGSQTDQCTLFISDQLQFAWTIVSVFQVLTRAKLLLLWAQLARTTQEDLSQTNFIVTQQSLEPGLMDLVIRK